MKHPFHRHTYLLPAILTVVALAGCSSSPEPVVIPDVVWSDGEPTGPLESNEWVIALREANTMLAVANNSLNYDFPELRAVTTPNALVRPANVTATAIREGRRFVFPGPLLMLPLEVTVTENGQSATVLVCTPGGDWRVTEDAPLPTIPPLAPHVEQEGFPPNANTYFVPREYELVRSSDGTIRFNSQGTQYREECDARELKVGLFDPVPALDSDVTVEDIVRPTSPGTE